ncbi:MAG TPA: HEAT repeat domain-containing protein [Acidimicrobiales bacterium]|nr:HEAT repeat domain-containing protein [Acidimicrobiales bacterium]
MAETPAETRRAVALAGHLGDEATARAGLGDPEPVVRTTALGALARLGGLTLGDVSAAAADPDARVRARAAELAADFGHRSVPLLMGMLSDKQARVTESACFALGEIGADAAPAVPGLGAVARDHPDALCREAAVAALGAVGAPQGLPVILAATADKPAVRRRAVLALAPFSGPEVDAALERALADRDWQVRQAAEDLTGRPG